MSRKKSYIPILAAATMALGLMAAGCGSGSDEGDENGNVKVFVPMAALSGEKCPTPPAAEAVPEGLKDTVELHEDGYLVNKETKQPVDGDGNPVAHCDLMVDVKDLTTQNVVEYGSLVGAAAAAAEGEGEGEGGEDEAAPAELETAELAINVAFGTRYEIFAKVRFTDPADEGKADEADKLSEDLYQVTVSPPPFTQGGETELTLYLNEIAGLSTEDSSIHFTSVIAKDNENPPEGDKNGELTLEGKQGFIDFTVTLGGVKDDSTVTVTGAATIPGNGVKCGSFGAFNAEGDSHKGRWQINGHTAEACHLIIKAEAVLPGEGGTETIQLPIRVGLNGGSEGYNRNLNFHFNAAPTFESTEIPQQINVNFPESIATAKITGKDIDTDLTTDDIALTQTGFLTKMVADNAEGAADDATKRQCLSVTPTLVDGNPRVGKVNNVSTITAEYTLDTPEWVDCPKDIDGFTYVPMSEQNSGAIQMTATLKNPAPASAYGEEATRSRTFSVYVVGLSEPAASDE